MLKVFKMSLDPQQIPGENILSIKEMIKRKVFVFLQMDQEYSPLFHFIGL